MCAVNNEPRMGAGADLAMTASQPPMHNDTALKKYDAYILGLHCLMNVCLLAGIACRVAGILPLPAANPESGTPIDFFSWDHADLFARKAVANECFYVCMLVAINVVRALALRLYFRPQTLKERIRARRATDNFIYTSLFLLIIGLVMVFLTTTIAGTFDFLFKNREAFDLKFQTYVQYTTWFLMRDSHFVCVRRMILHRGCHPLPFGKKWRWLALFYEAYIIVSFHLE